MKHGTPEMPRRRALRSSPSTSASAVSPASHFATAARSCAAVLVEHVRECRLAGQPLRDRGAIEAALGRDIGEDGLVADVAALLEIGAEQRFDQRIRLAVQGRVADQAVRVAGVRRAPDAVEGEGDVLASARRGDRRIDAAGMGRIAELGGEIVGPRHAALRHVGVELEGAPGDRHGEVRTLLERASEAPLADEAPRADDVGDDVDMHGRLL